MWMCYELLLTVHTAYRLRMSCTLYRYDDGIAAILYIYIRSVNNSQTLYGVLYRVLPCRAAVPVP